MTVQMVNLAMVMRVPGKRSSMEDFYDTRIDGVDGETVGLFGVFDGNLMLFHDAISVLC